jgi:hypothetical protein
MGKYFIGFAAQQKAAKPLSAVRCHKNKVAAWLFCGVNDRLIRYVAGCRQGWTVDADFGAHGDDLTKVLVGLLVGQFGKFFWCCRVDQGSFTKIGDRVFWFGEKNRDAGTGLFGEGNGALGCRSGREYAWTWSSSWNCLLALDFALSRFMLRQVSVK